MVIIVFGLPGTGKTYLSKALSDKLGAAHLNTDIIRHEINMEGEYDKESKEKVYKTMHNQLMKYIKGQRDVIVDATFHKSQIREQFIKAIMKQKELLFFIEMKASEKTIRERLKKRKGYSEADFNVYKQIEAQFEPFYEPHLIIWSDRYSLEQMIEKSTNYIQLKKHK